MVYYYSFGIHIQREQGQIEVRPSLGITDPKYGMLTYLNVYNQLVDVKETVTQLENVLNGTSEVFDWGQDWCVIVSKKENSTIEYFNHDEPDWQDKPLYMEMPTKWLYHMMKDWAQFLTINTMESYSTPKVVKPTKRSRKTKV